MRRRYVVTEPLPKDLDYPEAHEFIAAYTQRYGEAPASTLDDHGGREAFNVIRHAIEKTVRSTRAPWRTTCTPPARPERVDRTDSRLR